ncbi:reverse transcriptase domain-containing protein [Tanacetum coccineum]|uniref:Reverse transcriptase domain-containing protein n=1 Tax=Tanacetum coccineum TaxID=301880 RepID=A0ABQ5EM71_9ASTR
MAFKVLLHHYGRFTSPPGRKFVDGIVATVDPVELSNFSSNQMKAILTKCLGYDENSATFLYIKKSNRSLDSGLVLLDDAIQDIDSIVSYTQTYQKLLHVYVSRVELSPLVVADQLEDGGMFAPSTNGKLELVVAVVMTCTPNSLGDMTVTLKDPTGIMAGTIHYKVFKKEDGYANSTKVGSVLILRNVSVFTPKPSKHYLNITVKNIVKVFDNDNDTISRGRLGPF